MAKRALRRPRLPSGLVLAGVLSALGSGAQGAATLPRPVDMPPAAVASSPGGQGLPEMAGEAPEGAPAISAISETTFPGETLVIAGEGLEGASLRVWAEGGLFDIAPLRADNRRMQAVVPEMANGRGLSPSTMLVWPVKDDRVGAPIRVNAAAAWWAWPAQFEAGSEETIRLFGKNLALAGADPSIALIGEDGRARRLEIVESGLCALEAKAPEDLVPGRYTLRAHNGSGGPWGWSEAVSFEVVAPRKDPERVIDLTERDARGNPKHMRIHALEPLLRKAVDEAAEAGGAVIQLPPGRHLINGPIVVPEGVTIVLRGYGVAEWAPEDQPTGGGWLVATNQKDSTVVYDHRGRSGETSFAELRGAGSRIEDMTVVMRSIGAGQAVLLAGRDQTVRRTKLISQTHHRYDVCLLRTQCEDGPANHVIEDCEFILTPCAIKVEDTDFTRISNCRLNGMYMLGRGVEANAISGRNSKNMIIEDCEFRSVERTDGRVLGRSALFGPQSVRHIYAANNRSVSVGSHSSVPAMEGNVSEQYLFHVGAMEGDIYPVVAAGPETVKVNMGDGETPEGFATDEEWIVFIARGRGVGQWRIVAGLEADGALRLKRPWRVIPDASSVAIVQMAFRHIAICDNFMDPAPDPSIIQPHHKTIGVYYFHLTFDTMTVGNTMKNIGTGVGIGMSPGSPCAWNTVINNTFENATGFAGGTSYRPCFFNEHCRLTRGWKYEDLTHWVSAGNVFRGNKGKGADVAAQFGWLAYARTKEQADYQPEDHSGQMMTVMENNELLDADRGVLVADPINWMLMRNNRITLSADAESEETIELRDPERVLKLLNTGE